MELPKTFVEVLVLFLGAFLWCFGDVFFSFLSGTKDRGLQMLIFVVGTITVYSVVRDPVACQFSFLGI
jgi:hypothetical protein